MGSLGKFDGGLKRGAEFVAATGTRVEYFLAV
jgi:hypothetical protein